ncbi:hypothetical protein PGT21_006788 [Puccinia graminis f. sp. tritici]|uniref:Uncharacterized protein n=1 Tax=Puccinia graminis f. sp. tritici TaxID=56615 RepID=A0A5B0NV86_PUCGR|nr:hypothetical protein PGT21_006788 [Puccinia graminis f. sp. tritici]KAA1093650.1 hypothetical protein PGTUg99_015549 [Puccinia graminis f. sp. tritici]
MLNSTKTAFSIALLQFGFYLYSCSPGLHELPRLANQPPFVDIHDASKEATSISHGSTSTNYNIPGFHFGLELPLEDWAHDALFEFEEYHRLLSSKEIDSFPASPHLEEMPWEHIFSKIDGPPDGPPESPYRNTIQTGHPPLSHDIGSTPDSNMEVESQYFPRTEYQIHDEMCLFEPGPVDLKQFGWINTLESPTWKLSMEDKLRQDFSDSRICKIIFEKDENEHLPMLVRMAFDPDNLPERERVLEAAKDLLIEVRSRMMQFLLVCTSPESTDKKAQTGPGIDKDKIYQLIKAEQENLLTWLMQQLQVEPAPEALFPVKAGETDARPNSTPSLQTMLYEYFLYTFPRGKKYIVDNRGWKVKMSGRPRRSKSDKSKLQSERGVSLGQAMKTQLAIYILGNYFKFTNEIKWKELIGDDVKFVDLFSFLKAKEHDRKPEHIRNLSAVLEELHVIPWASDLEEDQIKDIKRFRDYIISTLKDSRKFSLDHSFVSQGKTRKLNRLKDMILDEKVPKQEELTQTESLQKELAEKEPAQPDPFEKTIIKDEPGEEDSIDKEWNQDEPSWEESVEDESD